LITLILYFVFSHFVSFTCSLLESVLLSCTPTYIALLKKKGSKQGKVLEELKAQIDKPLAGILTLNTFAHTIGAAGVGASAVKVFGTEWLGVVSIVITLTMLYFTEMVPKTIGAVYWKHLAPYFVSPLKFLIIITYPFVITFNAIAKLISGGRKYDRITEDDILVALEAGAKAGVIEEEEQDMVENIFRLGDRRVGMLMQPRVDLAWIDLNATEEEVREEVLAAKQEIYLVCEGEIDNVKGMIHVRDLLLQVWNGHKFCLKSLMNTPQFINETVHVFELLDHFKKNHGDSALVTDEYGVIQGLITLSDITKAIIKDVDDLHIGSGGQIIRISATSWIMEGKTPIDEFKDIFHFESLPHEEKARYRTISGLAMHELGAIPKKGDQFTLGKYQFEVIQVKKRRVEKILIILVG
jgi:putative hemolysin